MSGTASRRYDGSRRRAEAERNHAHIAACARRLFVANGYAATTIDAIAEDAGVAPQTIYAAFGSKKGVLEHLVGTVVNDPVPVAAQDWLLTARTGPTFRDRIRALVDGSAGLLERSADVFAVLHEAQGADPDLMEMWQEGSRRRHAIMSEVVQKMVDDGLVTRTTDTNTAADALWVMTSPELFNLFVADRSWTTTRYCQWLERHIVEELQKVSENTPQVAEQSHTE